MSIEGPLGRGARVKGDTELERKFSNSQLLDGTPSHEMVMSFSQNKLAQIIRLRHFCQFFVDVVGANLDGLTFQVGAFEADVFE